VNNLTSESLKCENDDDSNEGNISSSYCQLDNPPLGSQYSLSASCPTESYSNREISSHNMLSDSHNGCNVNSQSSNTSKAKCNTKNCKEQNAISQINLGTDVKSAKTNCKFKCNRTNINDAVVIRNEPSKNNVNSCQSPNYILNTEIGMTYSSSNSSNNKETIALNFPLRNSSQSKDYGQRSGEQFFNTTSLESSHSKVSFKISTMSKSCNNIVQRENDISSIKDMKNDSGESLLRTSGRVATNCMDRSVDSNTKQVSQAALSYIKALE
jgi:hypothetical protein